MRIEKELTAKGIKTPKGGTKWCESTIRGILKKEKYIGDVLMGKTFTIDPISHKRLSNLGEVDKHFIAIPNSVKFDIYCSSFAFEEEIIERVRLVQKIFIEKFK